MKPSALHRPHCKHEATRNLPSPINASLTFTINSALDLCPSAVHTNDILLILVDSPSFRPFSLRTLVTSSCHLALSCPRIVALPRQPVMLF